MTTSVTTLACALLFTVGRFCEPSHPCVAKTRLRSDQVLWRIGSVVHFLQSNSIQTHPFWFVASPRNAPRDAPGRITEDVFLITERPARCHRLHPMQMIYFTPVCSLDGEQGPSCPVASIGKFLIGLLYL